MNPSIHDTAKPSAPHSLELAKAAHALSFTAQYPTWGFTQAVSVHVFYPVGHAVHVFVLKKYPSIQEAHFVLSALFVAQPF